MSGGRRRTRPRVGGRLQILRTDILSPIVIADKVTDEAARQAVSRYEYLLATAREWFFVETRRHLYHKTGDSPEDLIWLVDDTRRNTSDYKWLKTKAEKMARNIRRDVQEMVEDKENEEE